MSVNMGKAVKGEKSGTAKGTGKMRGVDQNHRSKEDWIGRQLRRVYDDAANEPIPDDLMNLLRKIDEGSDDSSRTT